MKQSSISPHSRAFYAAPPAPTRIAVATRRARRHWLARWSASHEVLVPLQRSLAASRLIGRCRLPIVSRFDVGLLFRVPRASLERRDQSGTTSSLRFFAVEIRRVQSGVWRHVKFHPMLAADPLDWRRRLNQEAAAEASGRHSLRQRNFAIARAERLTCHA
jgi:hypothetical protein